MKDHVRGGVDAYRLDEVVSAVGQTSDVDLGHQFTVDWVEERLGAVDAHHGLFADFHADASLQFIHWDLQGFTQVHNNSHPCQQRHLWTNSQSVAVNWRLFVLTTCHCPSLMAFPPLVTLNVCWFLNWTSMLPFLRPNMNHESCEDSAYRITPSGSNVRKSNSAANLEPQKTLSLLGLMTNVFCLQMSYIIYVKLTEQRFITHLNYRWADLWLIYQKPETSLLHIITVCTWWVFTLNIFVKKVIKVYYLG